MAKERAKRLLLARAMSVKTIAQRTAEAKAAIIAAIDEARLEAQMTEHSNGVLISCRVPMGTRYLNRGKHKDRFLLEV